jgi:hypothetical protein
MKAYSKDSGNNSDIIMNNKEVLKKNLKYAKNHDLPGH